MGEKISYVLSTAALLNAVGVSSAAALPISAVANWVLRDGLGSAGVMLVASRFGKTMDSRLKASRWLCECTMVMGTMMEMMTPLVPPSLFLPVASLANTFKGLGGLVNGASKAALHRHFARDGNLAEITAQSHSQQTASYILGTTLGLALTSFHAPWTCFFFASALQLWATHKAIDQVALQTVDASRFPHLVSAFLLQGTVPTPKDMISLERFHWPFVQTPVVIGASVKVLPDGFVPPKEKLYIVHRRGGGTVYLLLHVDATDLQCAEGAFDAYQTHLGKRANFSDFCAALVKAGWNLEEGLSLESRRIRYDHTEPKD